MHVWRVSRRNQQVHAHLVVARLWGSADRPAARCCCRRGDQHAAQRQQHVKHDAGCLLPAADALAEQLRQAESAGQEAAAKAALLQRQLAAVQQELQDSRIEARAAREAARTLQARLQELQAQR